MLEECVARNDGTDDFVIPDYNALRTEEVVESLDSGGIVEF